MKWVSPQMPLHYAGMGVENGLHEPAEVLLPLEVPTMATEDCVWQDGQNALAADLKEDFLWLEWASVLFQPLPDKACARPAELWP